jgi:hypothetical protein
MVSAGCRVGLPGEVRRFNVHRVLLGLLEGGVLQIDITIGVSNQWGCMFPSPILIGVTNGYYISILNMGFWLLLTIG